MESKQVEVTLESDDDQDCMPKIINTVSLHGCHELSFNGEQENKEDENIFYPECEIKEENINDEIVKKEAIGNGYSDTLKKGQQKRANDENTFQGKRLQPTHLPTIRSESVRRSKPSTSRKDDRNVVDAGRLALQENLFKTKELFDTFLRVCQDQENTPEMERVVEKLTKAYGATRQEFLGSQTFQNLLEAETEKVNTSSTKPWLNLKLVLDELKHNKKSGSSKLKLGESEDSQDAGGSNDDEPFIECPKKRRHLKKLEKVLRAINLKIKKLEEREVDWDEEDNSAYCKLDRYRGQFTKIYTKICEIKGKLPDADRPYLRKVSFAGTTYPHINRCIERYYNKHRQFPDFLDIMTLVTEANKQEGIDMPPIKIHSMAAAAFKEFGEMLKRLRQYDDYDVIISYLDQQVDPARDDAELQEQLNKNALMFQKREQEVIDKFAEQASGFDPSDHSDSKPKEKRRIMITNLNPKKKSSSPVKKHLSSSDSSEEDENHKAKSSVMGLSSDSDSNESDSEKIFKKETIKNKGKTLIGRQRIVKKGVKKGTPKASEEPKMIISSDENRVPKQTKESLTNYLGLRGRNGQKTTETKSEDEINCVSDIPRPKQGTSTNKQNVSDDSESEFRTEMDEKSESSYSSRSVSKTNDEPKSKVNTIADSDSDIEPIAVVSKQKPRNQARKKTGPRPNKVVPNKRIVNLSKIKTNDIINISDKDSGNDSAVRKSVITKGLGNGTRCLSQYSDEDVGKKMGAGSDDTIVILSEEVVEETKPATQKQDSKKNHEDSSDSDDICILSHIEAERRTVAPRKTKPNNTTSLQKPLSTLNSQRVRASAASSTPVKQQVKRRLSKESDSENNKRPRKVEDITCNANGKQATLPHIINGAARKILVTRIQKSANSSSSNTPEPIPLIELD